MSDNAPHPTDAEIEAALARHPIFGPAMRGEVTSMGIAPPFGITIDRRVPPGLVVAMQGEVIVGAIGANGVILGTAEIRELQMRTLEDMARAAHAPA